MRCMYYLIHFIINLNFKRMRKNFLLLFLMALLPLAGWAADITTLIAPETITYGSTPTIKVYNEANSELTVTTDYTVGFYSDADCTVTVADIQKASVGTYYVQVKGVEPGYTGTITRSFKIDPSPLEITIGTAGSTTEAGTFVMDFKGSKPSMPAKTTFTYPGVKNSESINNILEIDDETLGYEFTGENANFKTDGTTALNSGTTAGQEYPITFKGFSLKSGVTNYTLTFAPRYMRIKQIDLTATGVSDKMSITRDASYVATSPFTYNGANQHASYTVTYQYGVNATDIYTLKSSDFQAKYYVSSASEAAASAINVATYNPVVAAQAKGNFSGTWAPIASTDLQFTINKAKTYVIVNYKEKTYDGKKFGDETTSLLGQATFTVSPLYGQDLGKSVVSLTAGAATGVTLAAGAGSYGIAATSTSISSAKIGSASGDDLSKNYDPEARTTEWKILPKDLTVTAVVASHTDDTADMTYGGTVPTINISLDGAVTDDETNIKNCYKATVPEDLVVGDNAITVALKPVADYSGDNDDAKATAKATAEEVLANYTITVNPGNLTVAGAGFTIIPTLESTYEYGDEITPLYTAFNSENGDNVTPAATVVFEYKKTSEAESKYTTTQPTAVGNYNIRVKSDVALAPSNYSGQNITYAVGAFSITKKELAFSIPDVTLHKGDTKTILNKYASIELEDGYALVGEETLEIVFDFVNGKAGTTAGNTLTVGDEEADYKIATSTAADSYANAIKVTLPADKANNNNYTLKNISTVFGKLIVIDGRELYIAGDDADITNKIADAATACTDEALATTDATTGVKTYPTYDVKLAARTLNGGKWNALVLPFEVTTLEFCQFVNTYAVFNVLKSADAANNSVKFGLELEKIPANTPFLVKPQDNVAFETTTTTGGVTTTTNITFTGRKIESATPTKTVSDAEFIGTYQDITINGGTGISVVQGGSFVDFAEGESATLGFTRAYLKLNGASAAPVITVEEIDGSVTAISNITADGVAVEADGWYTLSGVKLEGAPAQKGIYIRNGKKIVIK